MAKQTSVWIREAMETGLEMPKQIQAFIKKKHGKEIARTYISTRKKTIKEQMGQTSMPTPSHAVSRTPAPKMRKPAVFNKTNPSNARQQPGNGDLMGALRAVQEAAEKVGGMRRLTELVDLLGNLK
jgi:hypothetical protein